MENEEIFIEEQWPIEIRIQQTRKKLFFYLLLYYLPRTILSIFPQNEITLSFSLLCGLLPFICYYLAHRSKEKKETKIVFSAFSLFPLLLFLVMVLSFLNIFLPQKDVLLFDSIPKKILFYAFIPAVSEELFLRGTLLSLLKDSGEKTSILISSLLFTFMHGSVFKMPYTFVASVLLSIIYLHSHSILVAISCHFLINLSSILLSIGQSVYAPIITLGISFILFLVFLQKNLSILKEHLFEHDEEFSKKIKLFLFSPLGAILLCYAIFLIVKSFLG